MRALIRASITKDTRMNVPHLIDLPDSRHVTSLQFLTQHGDTFQKGQTSKDNS